MPDEIRRINDLQNIRNRPAMYFGDLNAPGVSNCLAREAYCLAIGQIISKSCSRVTSIFTSDGFVSVNHDGEPLNPFSESDESGLSEMQSVAQELKFCAEKAAREHVNKDFCRHGMAALNALSQRFELHSHHEGSHFVIRYAAGELEEELSAVGETDLHGVTVRFLLDSSLVGDCEFDLDAIKEWFSSLPIDTTDVQIQWNDFRKSLLGS